MTVERTLYHRDASFWRYPGRAVRYHLPRDGARGPFGHAVAICNARIQLDDGNTCRESEAGPLYCRRCMAIGATKET